MSIDSFHKLEVGSIVVIFDHVLTVTWKSDSRFTCDRLFGNVSFYEGRFYESITLL